MSDALSSKLMKVIKKAGQLLEEGKARDAHSQVTECLSKNEEVALAAKCRWAVGELYELKGRCELVLGTGRPRETFERGWAHASDGALCELFEYACFVEKKYEEAIALADNLRGSGRLGSEDRFLRKNRVVGYCRLMLGEPERAVPCYERIHSACYKTNREELKRVRAELEKIGKPAAGILEWFGQAPKISDAARKKNREFWDGLEPNWQVQLRKALVDGLDRKRIDAAMKAKSPPPDEDLELIHWLTALELDSKLPVETLAPLQELPGLQELEARYVKLPAKEWGAVAALKKLRSLNIAGTGIKDLDFVAGLTQLEELDAHDNTVATLSPLAKLTNLRELDFESRSGDLGPLKKMALLEKLICKAPVKSFEPLSRLSSLRTLQVDGACVKDLRGLEGLGRLETLELSEPDSLEDVSALRALKGLKKLMLYRAPQVGDFSPVAALEDLVDLKLTFSSLQDVSWVAGLKSLKRIDVGFAKVADLTPLAQCTKLEKIDAYRSEGSVAGLPALKTLPMLRRLEIRTRSVTRAELADFQKSRPKVEIEEP